MLVDIWGGSPLAAAAAAAAASFGWDVGSGGNVIAVAPLASTVAGCDAVMAQPVNGTRALAWPTVGVTAVQQMIGRCGQLGALTNLSSRATRPRTRLVDAMHDQVALLLLIGQISGHSTPSSVSLRSLDDTSERLTMQFDGFAATVDVTWNDAVPTSLDVQAAGAAGVLRIDTDPITHLEHNGTPVPLPQPAPVAAELEPLRAAGLLDVLTTLGTAFSEGRPLAHAYSFEFGRSVVAIIEAAERSRSI